MTWINENLANWLLSADGTRLLRDFTRWYWWKNKTAPPSTHELIGFVERLLSSDEFEFRNIVDYRLRIGKRKDLTPFPQHQRSHTLFLNCKDIGGGLIVQHGHSTNIFARRIGEDFWVNQNVTIGSKNGAGSPTIGNNVSALTGCVIVGGITIGDNSTITANAVVSFDVPPNCKVYPQKSVIIPFTPD